MRNVIAYFRCSVALERVTRVSQVGPADRVFHSTERLFLTCRSDGRDTLRSKPIPSERGEEISTYPLHVGIKVRWATFPADKKRNGRLDFNPRTQSGACSACHRQIEPQSSVGTGEQASGSSVSSALSDSKQS